MGQHVGQQFGPDGVTETPAPTTAPTLTSTMTTTSETITTTNIVSTTSEPTTCELEVNTATCVSQGGSFKCKRCTNGITGELCCSCHTREDSSTTPASTLATTTTSTSVGLCKQWCASNPSSWEQKCKWNKCAARSPCSTRRLRGNSALLQV